MGPQVRTLLRPPGKSSKDGASPAETRWGTVFCSPAGYGCSRLTATGCAQYAPKSVGLVGAAVISGLLVGWPDRRRVPAVHCRIEPFLYQGGACGVWPGVSAR